MRLAAISPREASIFACLCDTVVAPMQPLPAVRETDTVEFFDSWLARAPRLNRAGLRALLYAAELAPLLSGFGSRMRALDEARRVEALHTVEGSRFGEVRQLVRLLKGMAFLSYYGSDTALTRLGYDADANVARAKALRAAEGRP